MNVIREKESSQSKVKILTVNRPEKRNALDSRALRELRKKVRGSNKPTVLKGEGDSFIAGADISEVRSLNRDKALEFAELGHSVADSIEESEVPVIAAVDGACMGGGAELALACDLRYATPRSKFGEPGVKIGVFGGWGGTYRLPRVVGVGKALELSLTGRTVDAEEALEMNLVNQVVEDAEKYAIDVAKNIADKRSEAVKAVRRSIRRGYELPKEEALEEEKKSFAELFEGGVEEMVDSYLEEMRGSDS